MKAYEFKVGVGPLSVSSLLRTGPPRGGDSPAPPTGSDVRFRTPVARAGFGLHRTVDVPGQSRSTSGHRAVLFQMSLNLGWCWPVAVTTSRLLSPW